MDKNQTGTRSYLIDEFFNEPNVNLNDWDNLMSSWEYIKTIENKNSLEISRLEVAKKSIFLEVMIVGRQHTVRCIYHDCKRNQEDCKDMKEVYYKSILDFINWYNENSYLI